MKLPKAPQTGVHFAQKYVYAGADENAWFADLDPKSQLRDESDSTDGGDDSFPSYRTLLFRMLIRPVINKMRILKYRLNCQKIFFSHSSKPANHNSKIKWAETELRCQEEEARERHGVRDYTEYQVAQTRTRVEKLRKRCLQKKRKRQMSAGDYIGD
jgi:hypothetical protein